MSRCAFDGYEQHERAWTWRVRCACGFRGHWRGSPDRAADDFADHQQGDDNGGHYQQEAS